MTCLMVLLAGDRSVELPSSHFCPFPFGRSEDLSAPSQVIRLFDTQTTTPFPHRTGKLDFCHGFLLEGFRVNLRLAKVAGCVRQ
jgi:hypothetical protein